MTSPAKKKSPARKKASKKRTKASGPKRAAASGKATAAPARKPRKKAPARRKTKSKARANAGKPQSGSRSAVTAESANPEPGFVILLDEPTVEDAAAPSPADDAVGSESTGDGFVILLDEPAPETTLTQEGGQIDLGAQLNILDVADLHKMLCERMTAGGSIAIDISALREVDAACVQLLAAFAAHAERQSIDVCWSSPAPVLSDVAARLDLEGPFTR